MKLNVITKIDLYWNGKIFGFTPFCLDTLKYVEMWANVEKINFSVSKKNIIINWKGNKSIEKKNVRNQIWVFLSGLNTFFTVVGGRIPSKQKKKKTFKLLNFFKQTYYDLFIVYFIIVSILFIEYKWVRAPNWFIDIKSQFRYISKNICKLIISKLSI